jgi:site-specific recombinase XerD
MLKVTQAQILIGLLYGCGLRCIETRSVRLQDLDFDENNKVVGGKKTIYHFHFNPSITKTSKPKKPRLPFQRPLANGTGGDFDNRYSNVCAMGVEAGNKAVGIQKEVHVHYVKHATHLLEDGLDIITLKDLLGHQNIELLLIFMWFYFTR